MVLNGFLPELSIFFGSLFLREIFLIPSVVAMVGRDVSLGGLLGAGVLGLIVNDVVWFLLIWWDPRKALIFVKEDEEEERWLPWRARTWFGLLMVSSLLVGSRLLIFWQMVRRRITVVSAIGTIVVADVIWGSTVIGMSWVFGRKISGAFEAYRSVALVILVIVLVILVVRRAVRRRAVT